MRLKEFEAKRLLSDCGISIPKSELFKGNIVFKGPVVLKAQVPINNRRSLGGIIFADSDAVLKANSLRGKVISGIPVSEVLVEEKLNIAKEFYVGVAFDTTTRTPVLLACSQGGSGVEGREVIRKHIEYSDSLSLGVAHDFLLGADIDEPGVADVLCRLYSCFVKNDLRMIDINPLVLTVDNNLIAADAVAVVDDDAFSRHNFDFAKRVQYRELSERERLARAIDESDYRGVAGRSFIELDGDIAVLASGGGASVTAVDALLSFGGRPANYVEYSGNPSAEKVEKLTKITLSKPSLSGLYVVGGVANFTRIDITIGAIVKVLLELKPKYPVVVRRGGPGEVEAFKLLEDAKTKGLNIHIFDSSVPITVSAKRMVVLSEEFKCQS